MAHHEGGGHTENVYVPELVDLSDVEGVEVELPAECIANPENCGALLNETPTEFGDESSVVPYEQVYGDYRDAANEALSDDLHSTRSQRIHSRLFFIA